MIPSKWFDNYADEMEAARLEGYKPIDGETKLEGLKLYWFGHSVKSVFCFVDIEPKYIFAKNCYHPLYEKQN